MKNLAILCFALMGVLFFSCKNNEKEVELEVETVDISSDEEKTYEVAQTDAVFKDAKIEKVFKQYLEIENALVNTNPEKTATEAKELEPMLKEIEAQEEVQNAVSVMATTEDIKLQREKFEDLSKGIERILEGSLESGTLYKQYCPMAFNNRGAYWISSGKNILNPYFGDKMLKCGRVEAEIQ